jgi:chemotaxis methyl-accepting protein methylase
VDAAAPQSYQPFAVVDALLGLRLTTPDRWRVHCVDINPRVVAFFARPGERTLTVFQDGRSDDYDAYFRQAGAALGRTRPIGRGKQIVVPAGAVKRITAEQLNIITQRRQEGEPYDLAIATNVLVYFDSAELTLALSNIRSMIRNGGYLVHNELRSGFDTIAQAAGFEPVQARTLRMGELYDAFAIYRAAQ